MIEMEGHFEKGAWIPGHELKLPTEMDILKSRVGEIERAVGACTSMYIDIHARSPSYVIVIGRFKGHDHIRAYNIPEQAIPHIIGEAQHLEKYATVRAVDPPHPQFRSMYPRM